jgi:hypothetical protein
MTIIPFAAARCIDCRAPVAIVRRTVEVPCGACCQTEHGHCSGPDHSHTLPDIGPFTVVDEAGERHECAFP